MLLNLVYAFKTKYLHFEIHKYLNKLLLYTYLKKKLKIDKN